MPARRCSNCAIDWPSLYGRYLVCPKCGEKTWFAAEIDAMSDHEVQLALNPGPPVDVEATAKTASELDVRFYMPDEHAKIIEWREKCFVDAGFSLYEAHTLAVRRDIDRVVVENAVKAGHPHKTVMEALL